ncbi:hypothetical protein QYM36_018858 [Artemia franciscana]|uniref:Uncharacterized protein n=1 Tax=Artemia franciscana TaxID=6661 RepID=A0AA88HC12_ARTSF|nr:hypothetical protein QYM36_018858 [Artemia franciscana]
MGAYLTPSMAIRCQLKCLELFADDDVATKCVQAPDVVGQTALVDIEGRKVDPLIRKMTLEVTMSITATIDSENKKEFNLNEVTRMSIIDSTKGYDKLQWKIKEFEQEEEVDWKNEELEEEEKRPSGRVKSWRKKRRGRVEECRDNAVKLAVITGAIEDNIIYCHMPDVIKRIEAFMETFKNVKGLLTESNNNISEDECLLVNDEDRWKRARFIANCTNPTHVRSRIIGIHRLATQESDHIYNVIGTSELL